MKILQIHKYFSRSRGGGSVTAFFQTKELLEGKGHQVIVFSMADQSNEPSPQQSFFADHFDLGQASFLQKVRLIGRTIWNREAQKKLEELIRKEKPDIAHVHNIYHYLTPAILHTLKKHRIPIVFKLSDYKAICPNYKLFIKGEVCQRCQGGKFYQCFLNRCLKNSWAFSLVGMIEAYVHKWAGSYDKVDLFLAPSDFMKEKCVQFGIAPERIRVLRNVVRSEDRTAGEAEKEERHLLYYGRVSEEKGIDRLIKAVKTLIDQGKMVQEKLLIVGKGPQKKELQALVKVLGLEKKVDFPGFKQGKELQRIVASSLFVVVPSIWLDNSPLVISEAGLLRKPVIVSDRGGSREMVLEGQSGFVYSADDEQALAGKIEKMLKLSSSDRRVMGEEGRRFILQINDPEAYYQALMAVYQGLLERNAAG